MAVRYDSIGRGYSAHRRADPRIEAAIHAALGDASNVVNVGAGTGSYEPVDRPVVPVEPSREMALQRPPHLAPAVLGFAEELPFADKSAEAAMAILTMQHWTDLTRGLAELVRIARKRVVLLTIDVDVEAGMWLFRDYVPEIIESDRLGFPDITDVLGRLGPSARMDVVPVPADCADGFGLAFWSRPEAVLDAGARAATSGFARLDDACELAAVTRLARDLADGTWDERNGELRQLESLDVGLRLITAECWQSV